MSRVTGVKPQKNNKRVNVYLDNKFGFGIDLENFVRLGLKVDQELSEGEIVEIVKKAELQKTLDKLLRFATLRLRSQKEIKDWFKRKKVHPSLQPELFKRLKHLELVDDEKFAAWWVKQRQEYSPKSKRILNQELKMKGIEKEVIEDVLGKTEINEEKTAKELLAKKAYKWQFLPKDKARQKRLQYLVGKGFGWEVIEKVLPKE